LYRTPALPCNYVSPRRVDWALLWVVSRHLDRLLRGESLATPAEIRVHTKRVRDKPVSILPERS